MATPFTFQVIAHKFSCGNDITKVTVVRFSGPSGAEACAYSCNMNIDWDGDPLAYAPQEETRIKDDLTSACWMDPNENTRRQKAYKKAKDERDALRRQKAALDPSTTEEAKKDLDRKIQTAQGKMEAQLDQLKGRYVGAKNFEKVFWRWCGVQHFTPDEARLLIDTDRRHDEPDPQNPNGPKKHKRCRLANDPEVNIVNPSHYEDIDGRFPVVQWPPEPRPGFFVSQMSPSSALNSEFKEWDQRHFLAPGAMDVQAYAALDTKLKSEANLDIGDTVLAIRLDNGASLTMPFLDSGSGNWKVAECSGTAYVQLGGGFRPPVGGNAPRPNNLKFLLLYLAFPNSAGQTPSVMLSKFATASNALDFPIILSFLAQAAVDQWKAWIHGSVRDIALPDNPLTGWDNYQRAASNQQVKPAAFAVIDQALRSAGFNAAASSSTTP